MKKPFNPVIPDYTPRAQKKVEEVTLTFKPCTQCCGNITTGYYARISDAGTCNKKCWDAYLVSKPSLIDHKE